MDDEVVDHLDPNNIYERSNDGDDMSGKKIPPYTTFDMQMDRIQDASI